MIDLFGRQDYPAMIFSVREELDRCEGLMEVFIIAASDEDYSGIKAVGIYQLGNHIQRRFRTMSALLGRVNAVYKSAEGVVAAPPAQSSGDGHIGTPQEPVAAEA